MEKKKLRIFRLNFGPNRREYVLTDDRDLVVAVSTKRNRLVDIGFDKGADEVCHEYYGPDAEEWER